MTDATKPCPDCGSALTEATVRCRCGWRASKVSGTAPITRYPCGVMPCGSDAICRIKTPTGWLNVCESCYDDYYRRRADKTCKELGLTTAAEKRAWVLAAVRRLADKWRPDYGREPGEDSEETRAEETA